MFSYRIRTCKRNGTSRGNHDWPRMDPNGKRKGKLADYFGFSGVPPAPGAAGAGLAAVEGLPQPTVLAQTKATTRSNAMNFFTV